MKHEGAVEDVGLRSPTPRETHEAPDRALLRRLLRFARPHLGVLLLAVLCSLVYAGARNLRAYLIKPLLDDVLLAAPATSEPEPGLLDRALGGIGDLVPVPGLEPSEAEPRASEPSPPAEAAPPPEPRLAEGVREGLRNVVIAGLLIVLVIPIAHFGQIYLVAWGMGRIGVDIQQAVCQQFLALPLSFHHRMTRGEQLSRAGNDAGRAHVALDLLFGDVAQSVLALVAGAALLLVISWQLTLLVGTVAPVLALAIGLFGRRIRRTARRRQETMAELSNRLVEILSGVKVIKAFRAQEVESARFRQKNLQLFRRGMRVVRERATSRTLVEGFNNAVGVAVLVLGAVLVLRGQWGLTAGDLAAFVTVMFTTYRPVRDLAKGWTLLQDTLPSAERFFELLDEPAEPADAVGAVRIGGVERGIRLENVSFSYGREPVLRDVSFEARAGELVAIVGRTGAGKTTLADLLIRFHDPDSGSITIDGVDLRNIARDSLNDQIAVVTQEPFLFGGSILENIRYGRPGASDDEVLAAARAAHVDEFVEMLPDGWDTDVGEVGARLSGGQRQRVTIARALLKDPGILIFDEATSSLDARSERHVQDAVAQLLRGRTTFVIAHRLSTIRSADRIVVLENGRVAATGRHDELMEREGLYRDLVELQTSA